MSLLKNKKLLVMDNSALAADAVLRAKKLGVKTIVANFYPFEKSASKQVADEFVDVDISDTDAMVRLVEEKGVDGVFIGWTDSHLPFYVRLCDKAGLPCCATSEQFDVLSNDKRKFKEACVRNGIPVARDYALSIDFRREDLNSVVYPVVVKPADGSGGRGVKKCENEMELIAHYTHLYETWPSKKIIVEEYIDSPTEVFFQYVVQDGHPVLSSAFTNHQARSEQEGTASAILHVFPSACIKEYKERIEPSVVAMLKELGIKNAPLSLQGFYMNGEFRFHEAGLRMPGSQPYVFTEKLTGANSLAMMIEYSLTGKMACVGAYGNEEPLFKKPCANYYISLKPGVIASIEGHEEVAGFSEVLQIAAFHKVGDTIEKTDSLDRVMYRMHVMADTVEYLADVLARISSSLHILSDRGDDMQLEKLTYERALEMVKNS